MRVKHTRIHGIFLTLALTAAALSGCSFKQGAATPTTAAPYADESTAEYERFEEAQLKERERFTRMEEELFRKEVGSCRLNLHFLLKNPESYGITSVDSLFPALTPEQMAQDNAEREEIKTKIFSAVSALKDERERSVIYGHYIQGKSFQSLCFKLCYSRSQIFRFARQGIEHISLKVGT